LNIKKKLDTRKIKTKNMLRGLLSNDSPNDINKILKKIENDYGYSEYMEVSQALRSEDLYSHLPVSKNFNTILERIRIDGYIVSEKYIVSKINENKTELLALLNLVFDLYISMNKGTPNEFVDICSNLRKKGGASIFLFRMLAIYRSKIDHDDADGLIVELIDNELSELEVCSMKYVRDAVNGLSNPRIDYFNIVRKIYEFDEFDTENIISRSFVSCSFLVYEDFKSILS